MRDCAGAVNAAIHKQDRAATKALMTKLAESCEDCHKVFKPEAETPQKVTKTEAVSPPVAEKAPATTGAQARLVAAPVRPIT